MGKGVNCLISLILMLFGIPLAMAGSYTIEHAIPSASVPLKRTQGTTQKINVFNSEWIYFGEENRRVVDVNVNFPEGHETFSKILGSFSLKCPKETRCDHWDRYGNFGLVLNKGEENETFIELDRFITPYRVGVSWEADLTALRPLLTGQQTMRVFIDTWVGEGHNQGEGWLFNATMLFKGGQPPQPEAKAVIPIWPHLSWKSGQPDLPVEQQVPPVNLKLPQAEKFIFRSFITGHGWNNRQNCAEFCSKTHFYTVADQEFSREIWRTNCWQTQTDGDQRGTWQYSRAGWCPGAQVFPWDMDVTQALEGRERAIFSYRLEDFEWLKDGDVPFYYLSGLLIVY